MAYDIFTDEWAKAWCEKINNNKSYKDNAEGWEWPLILKMPADPDSGIAEDRAVLVDLQNGTCNSGKAANTEDLEKAPYIVSANPKTWKKILEGDMDLMTGIMWGKVSLEKGKIGDLAKYVSAAKQLVVSATKVDTTFPDGL